MGAGAIRADESRQHVSGVVERHVSGEVERHVAGVAERDVAGAGHTRNVYIVFAARTDGVRATTLADDGSVLGAERAVADLAREVAEREADRPRWVWDDTSRWYPTLLDAGVRVERCIDLRLCHAILRASAFTAASPLALSPRGWWDQPTPEERTERGALFELDPPEERADPVTEFLRQREAVAGSGESGRLSLLLSAESAGALAAAEMKWTGLPWDRAGHEALLQSMLGPRPTGDERPARMRELLERIRESVGQRELNPDSPPDLLKALNAAGIRAESTRSWELKRIDHPAIPPLLEYKRLSRLLSANGWHWLEQNVVDGRFHPDYVPGGVVTGRWASKGGGGALQLPKQVRSAVVADPGWKLVVADAAQLEPRILAALSADRGMVHAGAAGDMYAGIVASGTVSTRDHAKVAMLGAMYGATSGESGRLLPSLARAYPRAIGFVEDAARAGERGEIVSTLLGRSSPPGSAVGYDETATAVDQARARDRSKAWGRFTRNFVVQGTAAEWALCWMASLRRILHEVGGRMPLASAPHLVFFMHDELVVHAPEHLVDEVRRGMEQAASDAGRLLFGELPVRFPLTIAVVDDYGQAK